MRTTIWARMSWRNNVTYDDLLSANDTQYDTIVALEQEIENLKRENGELKKVINETKKANTLLQR